MYRYALEDRTPEYQRTVTENFICGAAHKAVAEQFIQLDCHGKLRESADELAVAVNIGALHGGGEITVIRPVTTAGHNDCDGILSGGQLRDGLSGGRHT